MLSSRGVGRSLGFSRAQRSLSGHIVPSRSFSSTVGNGRQFDASPRGAVAGGLVGGPRLRARRTAVPILLGAASTSRSFSLWESLKPGDLNTAPPAAPVAPAQPPSEFVPEAAAPSLPSVETTAIPSEVDHAAVVDHINNVDVLDLPVQLGYLHAMGLDFGYGPTSTMQWILEHINVMTGYGWGASIVLTTVLLRLAMLYPQIKGMQFSAGMAKVKEDPDFKGGQEIQRQGFVNRDQQASQKGKFMMDAAQKRAGVSKLGMVWGFVQLPLSFGLFRLIKNMGDMPIPSMETGGYWWFVDLTTKDPLFILPIAASSLMFVSIWMGIKHSPPDQQRMIKKIGAPFGLLILVFSTFFSAGINLTALATAAMSTVTTAILNTPSVRRKLNLPITKPTIAAPPSPATGPTYLPPSAQKTPKSGLGGITENISSTYAEVKQGLSKTMNNASSTSSQDKAARAKKDRSRESEEKRKQQARERFEKKYKGRH